MEIKGELFEKLDVQQITDTFKKRVFVLHVPSTNGDSRYDDYVPFELKQDKVTLIDSAKIGDELQIKFNLKGNKYEKDGVCRYFGSNEAWKIEVLEKSALPQSFDDSKNNDSSDGLPF